MKTVILAGGAGSRLGDATRATAKAMVTIGGLPILTHIMRIFIAQGHSDFIVATGHRAESLLEHFSKPNELFETPYRRITHDAARVTSASGPAVTVVDTGTRTGSAGRLLRLRPWLDEARFFLAWCDGLADLDLGALLCQHASHARTATIVAVRPPPRFGRLTLEGDRVAAFEEKPDSAKEWINGGFFVLEPQVMRYIESEDEMIERDLLPRLAAGGELIAYRHHGFWECMDNAADRERLEALWRDGATPWRRLDAAP